MRDKTIRALGATIVLLGVAVVAILQTGTGGDPSAISLTPEDIDTTVTEVSGGDQPDTTVETTIPSSFTYRVGVLNGIDTTNFWAFYGKESSVWDAYILGPTKPALYTLSVGDGSITGELAAETVQPIVDATGWHVMVPLVDNLEWSDGRNVTAHDVVFTFNTVRALGLEGSWANAFPGEISAMHADSDTDLRIDFSERPNLAVWPHSPGLAPIMAAHVWSPLLEGADRDALYAMEGNTDVGGGALTVVSVEETRVVSVANPGYPLGSAPDTVEYHVYETEADAVAALSDGEIDSILTPKGLTASHLAEIGSDPLVAVETNPANGVRYLGFNLTREPMSDHAFRTSLALLLDRDQLAGSLSETSTAAFSFVRDSNTRWFDIAAANSNAQLYSGQLPDRLASAVESLRAAGYTWETEPTMAGDGGVTPGAGLMIRGMAVAPLTILTPGDAYDPSRPVYATEIANALGWLGFDVRPVETDFDTVVDLAFSPGEDGALHYDMYLLGWTLGNPALPDYYRPLFAADGVMNNTGYTSQAFAENLAAYEGSYTFEEARSALWSMERTLATDLPYLLLYATEITEVYRQDRVAFDIESGLGGLQGRLGGIGDVRPVS